MLLICIIVLWIGGHMDSRIVRGGILGFVETDTSGCRFCRAYDLVMEPYNSGSADFEDYGIWDKEVVSPVEGTVVAAYDEVEDIPPNTEAFISPEGNHVYIQIKETGTYLLLNHLKKNSVIVEIGDQVNVGDLIARVGNSGSTSEPHLHIHHQRQNPLEM